MSKIYPIEVYAYIKGFITTGYSISLSLFVFSSVIASHNNKHCIHILIKYIIPVLNSILLHNNAYL